MRVRHAVSGRGEQLREVTKLRGARQLGLSYYGGGEEVNNGIK